MAKTIKLTDDEKRLLREFRQLPRECQQILLKTSSRLVASSKVESRDTVKKPGDDFDSIAERNLHRTLDRFPPKTTEVNFSRIFAANQREQ